MTAANPGSELLLPFLIALVVLAKPISIPLVAAAKKKELLDKSYWTCDLGTGPYVWTAVLTDLPLSSVSKISQATRAIDHPNAHQRVAAAESTSPSGCSGKDTEPQAFRSQRLSQPQLQQLQAGCQRRAQQSQRQRLDTWLLFIQGVCHPLFSLLLHLLYDTRSATRLADLEARLCYAAHTLPAVAHRQPVTCKPTPARYRPHLGRQEAERVNICDVNQGHPGSSKLVRVVLR